MGLLFLPALWFMCVMFEDLTDDGEINGSNTWRHSMGMHRLVAGFICMFASLAYLTMATGHGYIVRCCDGRSFYYARYIDWTITTPLMIWELASLARASYNDTLFLIFLDILMIISGLIGALVCSGEKWAFFGFSILCFIPILTSLCQWDRAAHEGRWQGQREPRRVHRCPPAPLPHRHEHHRHHLVLLPDCLDLRRGHRQDDRLR